MKLALIHLVARILTRLGRCFALLDADGEPYLIRYVLIGNKPGRNGKKRFNVFLHNIQQPDADRWTHSHPWLWARGRILHGEYLEIRPNSARLVKAGESIRLRPGDYHRIAWVEADTWTLFCTGPKHSHWGFLVPGKGHVDWDKMPDLSISDWKEL